MPHTHPPPPVQKCGGETYQRMVGPSEELSKNIGNSYAAAVWANLLCLADTRGKALEGKRIGMFSYGSGALASMFAFDGAPEPPGSPFTLARVHSVVNLPRRLAGRTEASPAEFVAALKLREASYGRSAFALQGSLEHIADGAYYLQEVGPLGTRVYARK